MNVKAKDKPIIVTAKIVSGPATPISRQQWKRFWSKVISTVKDEVRSEQQRDQKPEDAIERLNDGDKEAPDFD